MEEHSLVQSGGLKVNLQHLLEEESVLVLDFSLLLYRLCLLEEAYLDSAVPS